MILPEIQKELTRRAYGFCVRNGRYGHYPSCKQSVWRRLGRWILVAVLLFLSFLVITVTLCCIARRRRKQRKNRPNPTHMTFAPHTANNPGYQQHYTTPSGAHAGGNYQPGVAQPPNAYVQ